MNVEALAPDAEAEWDAFVAARADRSHYHRAGWAHVIREAFGQQPLYRLARENGCIVGVLPLVAFANPLFGRYLVSVPYLNRGGILAASDAARDALLEEGRRLLRETRSRYCELRHREGEGAGNLPSRVNKVSMSLPVGEGREVLWKNVGAKVRNLVRKAERAGLTVREGAPGRDLDDFYRVFSENMRDLGTPVYSRRFFDEIFRRFPDDVRLNVVEAGSRTAAAGICVTDGDVTEIHWAASSRELLRQSPNMLLYWEAIAHAADSGLGEFCFGRSTEGSGPWRFKKQWGAVPTRLRWEYLLASGEKLPELNPESVKFRMATRVWRKLPLSWTRALGPPIVRHIP